MKCIKCGGEMETGFIADHGVLGTEIYQNQKWSPEKGTFLGLKNADPQKDVQVFRCKTCGYLESYAK